MRVSPFSRARPGEIPRELALLIFLACLAWLAGMGWGGQAYLRGRMLAYMNRDSLVLSMRWPSIIAEHAADDARADAARSSSSAQSSSRECSPLSP